jgi:hypothetical protein
MFLYSHICPLCDHQTRFVNMITWIGYIPVHVVMASTLVLWRKELTSSLTYTCSSKFSNFRSFTCLNENIVCLHLSAIVRLFVSEMKSVRCRRVDTANCKFSYYSHCYMQSANNIYGSRLTHLHLKVLTLPFFACIAFSQYWLTSPSDIRITKSKRLGRHEDSGENLKVRDHWVDLGVGGRIILKLVSKQGRIVRNGFVRFRIGTIGGLLCTR